MNHQRTSYGFAARLFFSLGIIVLILLLAGCGSSNNPATSSSVGNQAPSGNTLASGDTPTPGNTPAPDNTSTPGNAPTHANTPTPGPVAFSVTGISSSASPNAFTGVCSDTKVFTFSATIHAPANSVGGTVSYLWLRSDGGSSSSPQTVSFAAGVTSRTVTTTWQLGAVWGNGTTFWEALKVTSPNTMTSPNATFSFHCQRAVTGISTNISPSGTCFGSSTTFNFTAVLTVAPGPGGVNITYTWLRSDHASAPAQTVHVNEGQTTVTVTTTWTLGSGAPKGTYWEQVSVSAPNAVLSNQAGFSIFAC